MELAAFNTDKQSIKRTSGTFHKNPRLFRILVEQKGN